MVVTLAMGHGQWRLVLRVGLLPLLCAGDLHERDLFVALGDDRGSEDQRCDGYSRGCREDLG